jgi:hypothetical protein
MKLHCVLSWLISILAGVGIAALYIYLLTIGYFPNVGLALWIGVSVSAAILIIFILKLLFLYREEQSPVDRYISCYIMKTIIGAIATIGNCMMALSGFLNPAAKSSLVLIYLSVMFFSFEMISLVSYASRRLKQ